MTVPNPDSSLKPLVSVAITSFNSEKWLAVALDSVLSQQTAFPFEVVIGDDCSQDRTVAIAEGYRERYPDVIRVVARNKNIGIQRNYYETFEACKGTLIAWLDADDYWTDPAKLAIQADAMMADPSIMVSGHFVRWVTHGGEVRRDRYPTIAAGRYGLAEILHHNFLPSPSVMFRNGIHRGLPAWYFDLAPTTDWPIYVLGAMSGQIVLIDRTMADYRLTPGSSLMGQGDLRWYETDARFYEHIVGIVPAKWRRLIGAERGRRYEALAYALRKQGKYEASTAAAVKAFRAPFAADNFLTKTKGLIAAVVREAEWKLRGEPIA